MARMISCATRTAKGPEIA